MTILIPINQGFSARFILQTDVFRRLQSTPGNQIVLLVPEENEYFRAFLKYPNVRLARYEMEKCHSYRYGSAFERRMHLLRLWVQNERGGDIQTTHDVFLAYLKDHRKRLGQGLGRLKKLAIWTVVKAFRNSKLLRQAYLWVEHTFFAPAIHREVFERFRPDVLVVTSLGTFNFDEYLMREARKLDIPVVSVILSWDNTTTRGMPGAWADHVLSWTENMKKELIQLNDVPEEKITVSGVPHFDHYYNEDKLIKRADLFQKLGLDPAKKVIFFVTKSPNGYAWNSQVAELILNAIESGEISRDAQLLVRLHPIYYRMKDGGLLFQKFLDEFHELQRRFPGFVINVPEMVTGSGTLNYSMPESEIIMLASILKHSDVVVNMFSTLNVEASIFDAPIVNVSFDAKELSPEERSRLKARYDIGMDERQTHNQRIIQTGGIAMAYSPDELVRHVNAYLLDRRKDQEGRRKIATHEAGPRPGTSGMFIADYIMKVARGDEAQGARAYSTTKVVE